MISEVWAKNPKFYIRECRDTDTRLFAWDRGTARKYSTDPQRFALAWLGDVDFRALLIGDQGAAEVDRTHNIINPAAVYPVWSYGLASLQLLERWMARDCTAELRERALKKGCPPDEVPVLGQERRVVITRMPGLTTRLGQDFLTMLGEMQRDYPECILHVHGYTTNRWIRVGIRSGDIDPRPLAAGGRVILPTGNVIEIEKAFENRKWISLIGMKVPDLRVARNRCMFNIQASKLAALHAGPDASPMDLISRDVVDNDDLRSILNGESLEQSVKPLKLAQIRGARKPAAEELLGDRFYCEACSYAKSCRAFQVESICSLPDADSAELARHFKTRDSSTIIEGLGHLIEGGIERFLEGRELETATGRLDPHVTDMQKQLFAQGVTLAKLVDPKLRTGALVQVNGGNGQINVGSAGGEQRTINARVGEAYAALQEAGVPESMITEAMLERVMKSGTDSSVLERILIEEAAQYALPAGLVDDDEVVDGEVVPDGP